MKARLVRLADTRLVPMRIGEPPLVDTANSSEAPLPVRAALERFASFGPAGFTYCHETKALQAIWRTDGAFTIYRLVTVFDLPQADFTRFFNRMWAASFDLKEVAPDTGARTYVAKVAQRGTSITLSPRGKGPDPVPVPAP